MMTVLWGLIRVLKAFITLVNFRLLALILSFSSVLYGVLNEFDFETALSSLFEQFKLLQTRSICYVYIHTNPQIQRSIHFCIKIPFDVCLSVYVQLLTCSLQIIFCNRWRLCNFINELQISRHCRHTFGRKFYKPEVLIFMFVSCCLFR
jgi:hypothetical protein